MSFVAVGRDRYIFDVYISQGESPTGKPVRIRTRQRCPVDQVQALDAEITHAAVTYGVWSPSTSIVLRGEGVAERNAVLAKGRCVAADKPKRVTATRYKQTLDAALELAWADENGWSVSKSGRVQYNSALAAIALLGAHRPCDTITRTDYETIRDKMRTQGRGEAAITRHLQALYRVLSYAKAHGWIKVRPKFKRRQSLGPRIFTFTPEVEAACIAFFLDTEGTGPFPKGMHEIFIAGVDAGLRLDEVLTMTGDNIDTALRVARVGSSDTAARLRTVELSERLAAVFERRIAEHGRWRIFPGWTERGVARRMLAARDRLDPDNADFVFNAARHTHLMRLAENGASLSEIMTKAGHQVSSASLRYMHAVKAARRNGATAA